MKITYRAGRKEDCSKLAELIHIASGGVVEFLYHELIPGQTPVQILAGNLAADYDCHNKRIGFEIVSHIEMDSHELIPHKGGAF